MIGDIGRPPLRKAQGWARAPAQTQDQSERFREVADSDVSISIIERAAFNQTLHYGDIRRKTLTLRKAQGWAFPPPKNQICFSRPLSLFCVK
jgi:hypothetical protein